MSRPYTIKPLTTSFGGIISDFTLTKEHAKDTVFVDNLKEDIHKYLVLVFKNQKLEDSLQVDISKAIGKVRSTFYKHPSSPHPDIFRVSNNSQEGCTGVGRTGWHIDGTFLARPFAYQTMHFPSISAEGWTQFVPLKQLYESQSKEIRAKWNRRYFVASQNVYHPLVYDHPVTCDPTMCFHCGEPFCAAWVENPGKNDQELFESMPGQTELTQRIESSKYVHTMKWERNDFAIMDNLAVAHYAVPGTQKESGGLRILHRTTIEGLHEPIQFKERKRQRKLKQRQT